MSDTQHKPGDGLGVYIVELPNGGFVTGIGPNFKIKIGDNDEAYIFETHVVADLVAFLAGGTVMQLVEPLLDS